MRKLSLFLVFALTLLVQIPFSSSQSITCSGISPPNYQTCLDILNSDLTNEEKSLLISNLDYSDQLYPDHNYIYDRNANLQISQPPQGVQVHNSYYIKNAWVDILAVMPSVLYKEALYVPDQANLLAGYNHYIRIPTDYHSSRYPRTSQGDCRRTYRITQYSAVNSVYVDSAYQGNGRLVSLAITSDSVLKSKYKIRVAVDINHYRWEEDDDGDYRCRYRYDDTVVDQLELTDTLNVKHYNTQPSANIQVLSQYLDTTKIYPEFSDSLELNFENANYQFHKFTYDIKYSKEPYYVYTLEAKDYDQEILNNLFKEGQNILVKNTINCHYKAHDFFNTIENDCSLLGEDFSLKIKTDKLKYKQDEEIQITITPNNVPVTLTYGDETKEATGQATFTVKPLTNKITAKYRGYTAQKVIFLEDKERLKTYWDLSIFGLLNYCIYAFLRKGIGRFI